jgi:hypothetical protein
MITIPSLRDLDEIWVRLWSTFLRFPRYIALRAYYLTQKSNVNMRIQGSTERVAPRAYQNMIAYNKLFEDVASEKHAPWAFLKTIIFGAPEEAVWPSSAA